MSPGGEAAGPPPFPLSDKAAGSPPTPENAPPPVPEDAPPRCSVIVVTYNSAGVVGQCLAPLADLPGVELVVVDNDSADDSLAVVRRVAPAARVLAGASNVGFARAVNAGAALARGERIVLLNPDAILTAADLEALLAAVDAHGGIVAPLITHPTGRLRTASGGRFPTPWRMFTHYSGLSRLAGRLPVLEGHYLLLRDLDADREVDWVCGACLAISRADWRDLGGLTDRWFMYAEDIELCLRARRAGLGVRIVTSARATHLVGASSAEGPADGPPSADDARPPSADAHLEDGLDDGAVAGDVVPGGEDLLDETTRPRGAGLGAAGLDPPASGEPSDRPAAPDVREPANPAWILNLYDLYARDISRGPAGRLAFRTVVSLGLASRAVAFALMAVVGSRQGTTPRAVWLAESRRFADWSRAVARIRITRPDRRTSTGRRPGARPARAGRR